MPPTPTVDQNGGAIRTLRQERKLTLVQLAEKVGCTPQTLSNIERGNKRCSVTMLNRIAAALDADPYDLVRGAEVRKTALLTIPEAARELDCSGMHVYRLIAEGALRAVDIAGKDSRASKLRVRRDDLDAFIDSRTSAAVAATA